MATIELGRRQRNFRPVLNVLYALLAVGLIAGIFFAAPRFEWKKPLVKITPDVDTIGLGAIDIDVTEEGTGLKTLNATLTAGGSDVVLANEEFSQPVMQKKINVALSAKMTGLKEGPAVLRIKAQDRSLWNFFRGNQTLIEKHVTIDVSPPTIELIADDRYVNFGGVGVIVYKPSADTLNSGVKIGNYTFPGYKGQLKDTNQYLAFFAHPYNASESERAVLYATDKAGNTREMKLVYNLKEVKYKTSTIKLSDGFIENKVTPLVSDVGTRQKSIRERFISVNKRLRKENEDKIEAIGKKSADKMLWQGPFTQLSNSKVEANFADARTYVYNDETLDKAYHLGFDLSVTKQYPVEAANSGVVSFVGDLGIYGNTVMIDHGLGLMTLYSHLSSMDVKVGDSVKQEQIIGKTGETGFAGGDHLHFGVYLQGVAILPKEWWDKKWINDNVLPKLEGRSSESVIEEAKEARKGRRAARAKKPA
ncbi:MAG: M23 family metallopeptidase [Deltaproteobacteria bacterium]|nr:M23 family metallopeptidase [Deltaproteobacteria bacterium]